MKVYNTLGRQIQEFNPVADKKVGLYTCGPTVYDYLHIGNWSIYVRWDLLVRVLSTLGYNVNWIMNITDVGHLVSDADEGEDKLEKGALREGKNAWEIADFYTDDFEQGLRDLNISIPLANLPRAAKHISEQIEMIKVLEDKGFTYTINDGVYFDTAKLSDYGKLANLKDDELKPGARVPVNPQKHSPADFALWKFSPEGQKRDMEWDSPWGKGFPGWHIECSAMAKKYLGDTLDIHAGGIDHIPVHHTNEIAQSEVANDKPLANYWLHANFFTVDGTKISKSLSNGITLHDIVKKGYDLMAYRLLVLQSHYRAQADFSWEGLEAAANRLKNLRAIADLRFQPQSASKINANDLKKTRADVVSALEDDLNTPVALARLSDLENRLENEGVNDQLQPTLSEFVKWLDEILGLRLTASEDISEAQKALIKERQGARDNKNWPLSDDLREKLKHQGLAIKDTESGQIWSRL